MKNEKLRDWFVLKCSSCGRKLGGIVISKLIMADDVGVSSIKVERGETELWFCCKDCMEKKYKLDVSEEFKGENDGQKN